MTTFEFFKEQYEAMHDYLVKCINPKVQVDSFEFVKIAWQNFFGGTAKVDPWYSIQGVTDTNEMFKLGYLKKWDDCSWIARQKGTSRHIALTAKGLKAFYKDQF